MLSIYLPFSRISPSKWRRCLLQTKVMKPLNILVKTDNDDSFNQACACLETALQPDTYTIYQIRSENFCKQPWLQTCALLWGIEPNVTSAEQHILWKFITECNGRVLLDDSSGAFDRLILDTCKLSALEKQPSDIFRNYVNDSMKVQAAICKTEIANISKNELISTLLHLEILTQDKTEQQDVDQHGYMFSSDADIKIEDLFRISERNRCGLVITNKNFNACFSDSVPDRSSSVNEFTLNVVTGNRTQYCKFNWKHYSDMLGTNYLGRNLIYFDVVASTQDFFTKLNPNTFKTNGLVVTARQQTKGKGRSGNQWLSPIGCMMFTAHTTIGLKSSLGRKLAFIQHIAVVAFVKSIRLRKGYEGLDVQIKWPNDIYIKKKVKIGGVIVNSTLLQDQFKVAIGLGVNISNEKPTECINKLIRDHNMVNNSNIQELTVEEALASTLNEMEKMIDAFQTHGSEEFKQEYYKHWMHSGTKVKLEQRSNEEVTITGLDETGYLLVELADGSKLSLQPDGNSFDMMRNMISTKR